MTFKPMLAGKAPADLAKLRFPLLASPKLDGIRCISRGGVVVSRKLLEIPNRFVQRQLMHLPPGLDGELMLALPGNFNEVQSAVMSVEGQPNFTFCIFDRFEAGKYVDRFHSLAPETVTKWWGERVEKVPHQFVSSPEELLEIERQYLAIGFEGVMLRCPNGPYKCGRSTEREGYLLKLKRFEDEEATVVGVVERMHNENEATTNELGLTKRSSAKAGKRPAGDLGALACVTDDGAEFELGSGFTEQQRKDLWAHGNLEGARVKFKHQPDPGGRQPGQAPRFPVFLGFRSEID